VQGAPSSGGPQRHIKTPAVDNVLRPILRQLNYVQSRRSSTSRPPLIAHSRPAALAQGHGEAFGCSRIPLCDQPCDLGVDRDEITALPCSTTTVSYRACFRVRYGRPINVSPGRMLNPSWRAFMRFKSPSATLENPDFSSTESDQSAETGRFQPEFPSEPLPSSRRCRPSVIAPLLR